MSRCFSSSLSTLRTRAAKCKHAVQSQSNQQPAQKPASPSVRMYHHGYGICGICVTGACVVHPDDCTAMRGAASEHATQWHYGQTLHCQPELAWVAAAAPDPDGVRDRPDRRGLTSRSGQVGFITRPKSRTMRATRHCSS